MSFSSVKNFKVSQMAHDNLPQYSKSSIPLFVKEYIKNVKK